jgi:hypothetical protein
LINSRFNGIFCEVIIIHIQSLINNLACSTVHSTSSNDEDSILTGAAGILPPGNR